MSGYTGPANPIANSGFYSSGQDIIGTFQQFVVGPKPSVTGISINGTDICNYFAPYYNGTKVNNVSGLMFNGVDLQSGFSPPYALSAGTTGTYIMPVVPSTLSIISCNLNTSPAIVTFTAPTIPNSISPATSTYTYKYYVNGSSTGTAATIVSSTQVRLTGMSLSAGTSYTIKVTGVNAVGESSLSSASSTTAWTVPSVPTVTSGSGSASSIAFNFTQSSGTVTNYTAYYSTSSTFSTSYSNVSVANNVTSATISSGISTGSSYYVFLVANNAGGSSSNSAAYGPIVTLSPPTAPTSINYSSFYDGATNSLNIIWSGSTGTIAGYYIYYSTSNSYSGTYAGSSSSTSFNITGLSVGTIYYIYIAAYNAAGSSGYSSIQTLYTPPTTPIGLTVSSSTSGSVSLYWTASTSGPNGIGAYYVNYGTSSPPQTYFGGTPNGTTTSLTVTGLSASTTYYFAVQAAGARLSSFSSPVSGTTSQAFLLGPYATGAPGNVTPKTTGYSVATGYNPVSAYQSGTIVAVTFTSSFPYSSTGDNANYPLYLMLNGWGANAQSPFSSGWVTNNGNGTYSASFNFASTTYFNPAGAGTNAIWFTWSYSGTNYSQNTVFYF